MLYEVITQEERGFGAREGCEGEERAREGKTLGFVVFFAEEAIDAEEDEEDEE